MWPFAVSFSLIFALACCYHVVRTRQELYWIFIILVIQPFGAIVYAVAVLLPDILRSARSQRIGRAARDTLDPNRAYREASRAVDDAPTVYNRMQLAEAATALGRHEEAARLYEQCLEGVYADDPALLLHYAAALVDLDRFSDGLAILDKLGDLGDPGRTPQAALLIARAKEGLGDGPGAEVAYEWAAERITGLEGLARHAAFLAGSGRLDAARGQVELLEKRWRGIPRTYRRSEAQWRDMALKALADARD